MIGTNSERESGKYLLASWHYYYYYYYYLLIRLLLFHFFRIFLSGFNWWFFSVGFRDSNSSQVSITLLSILPNLNCTEVRLVSIFFSDFKFANFFFQTFVDRSKSISCNYYHRYLHIPQTFSSLAKPRYLLIFLLPLFLIFFLLDGEFFLYA